MRFSLIFQFLLLVPSIQAGKKPSAPQVPPPTGIHRVGRLDLPVTDNSRADRFDPSSRRRVLLSIFYPTTERSQPSPYIPAALAQAFETTFNFPPTLSTVRSHAKRNAHPLPLPTHNRKRLIFSHGGGTSRLIHAALHEDLASHGYIVISIDHPYDATAVQFPDGQVIRRFPGGFSEELVTKWYTQRLEDIAFVDDFTADLSVLFKKAGRRTPAAVFGHSFGGAVIAGAMVEGPSRFVGGLNFDGAFWGSSVDGDVQNPFFLVGPPERAPPGDESWVPFKAAQSEWVKEAHINGTGHYAFSDFSVYAEVLGWRETLGDSATEELVGTIDGFRITDIQRKYTKDFMDWGLRGGIGRLSNGPSLRFPEITFV